MNNAGKQLCSVASSYRDGRRREICIDAGRPGSALALEMNDSAVLASIALRQGIGANGVRGSIAGPSAAAVKLLESRP